MTQMELMRYTEDDRDELEQMLADEANKPEIHYETRHGLGITVYYLRRMGEISMSLSWADSAREFIIPNDRVNDAIAHPEVYANSAGLPRPNRPHQEAE